MLTQEDLRMIAVLLDEKLDKNWMKNWMKN